MMAESAKQKKIDRQCQRYPILHKPTGVRYRIELQAGGMVELHPISGRIRYASLEALDNAEVWEVLR